MTDLEIIGTQAKHIFQLQHEIKEYESTVHNITTLICGIGGPLNDNKLHFTKEQLTVFSRIMGYMGK